jgi:hypothetical protein
LVNLAIFSLGNISLLKNIVRTIQLVRKS